MPTWDPDLYLRFANERTQPTIDLVARLGEIRPGTIIDLGCGPGNSTAILLKRFPEAKIVGLDNSDEMIEQARAALPLIDWIHADVRIWKPDYQFDLIFSNAALQWVPDHARLFPQLMGWLNPAGLLAVQMPLHYDSPLQQIIQKIARDPSWAHRMDGPLNALTRHPSGFYHDILSGLSTHIDIWQTEYFHQLESPQAIVDWIRGTGLRPFLEALTTEAERQQFEEAVLAGTTAAYPRQKDGRVLFPFKRQFLIAHA